MSALAGFAYKSSDIDVGTTPITGQTLVDIINGSVEGRQFFSAAGIDVTQFASQYELVASIGVDGNAGANRHDSHRRG